MLHLGLIKPQLRENTDSYKRLVKSVVFITVIDTLILGFISFVMNIALGRVGLEHFLIFILVPTVACMFAVGASIPLTTLIAIETFKRGLDPDILVYPILASINDIVVTAFFVITIFAVLSGGIAFSVLVGVFILIILTAGFLGYRSKADKFFIQTLKEGTLIVVLSSIFGGINGVFLSGISSKLSKNPGLVVLYPALTNALGNIGSIIGSRTTTNIALGYARSFKEELKDAGIFIILVEIPAAFMHFVFAIISFILTGSQSHGDSLLFLLSIALMTNLFSFLIISVFSLYLAYLAFQRGLNPDNVVIPAITSVSDTTATITILSSIFLAKIIGL